MSEKPVKILDTCSGCGICTQVCTYNSIAVIDGVATVSDSCRVCGACVDSCPSNSIEIKKIELRKISEYKGILVFAEQRDGIIHPVVYELLGKGKMLADQLGEQLLAVILGENLNKQAETLIAYGADKVYVYDDPRVAVFRDDPYTQLLCECVEEVHPNIFLIGATAIGRAVGPRIAAKLHTGLTADCTSLDIDSDTRFLQQTRPAYGGNIMATIITPNHRPQMATVRYKVMNEAKPDFSRSGEVISRSVSKKLLDRVKVLGYEASKEKVSITDADIIVSGGKGLGSPEGFKLIGDLAIVLGGAVGASRPTIDEGWIQYRHQVGLSGRTVRPKLYIACGISGAVQHLAGMKTSDVIIAINKDKDAPICKVSSLTVVGDLYEVLPRLIAKIKEQKKSV